MGTNRKKLVQGLKYELIALPLLILGPIAVSIGFKALKSQQDYVWLILGIIICTTAIILGFLGIRIILNAFFEDE